MSKTNSTPLVRPNKPRPDFPLYPHRAGQWAAKVNKKTYYFGKWDDPDAAEARFNREYADLKAGRVPKPDAEAVTVKVLVNAFLNLKRARIEAGELSPRTQAKYKATTDILMVEFGRDRLVSDIGQDDLAKLRNAWGKSWGVHRIRDTIQQVRCIFKFAYDAGLIDRPFRFGPGFDRPSMKAVRLHRAKGGIRMFEAAEINTVLKAASPVMKAMVLVGLNAGYGNADVGQLPLGAVNLETGWIDFPRPKTGIPRRCPLWPETIAAIEDYLAVRPEAKDKDDAALVFVTKYGQSWHKDTPANPLSAAFRKLLKELGINGARNFYGLRRTFATIASDTKDQVATDYIMGHVRDEITAGYRERISDERLKAVAEHVRKWLLAAMKPR